MWLQDAAVPRSDLDFALARRLESLLQPDRSGRKVCLPGGMIVQREYGFLKLEKRNHSQNFSVKLQVPGETIIPECGWRIK
ncbi:MAG: hypothetical protein ABR497_11140, partial [Kiritimatiellia bacterium]